MKHPLSLACCALMLTCLLASCQHKVVTYSLQVSHSDYSGLHYNVLLVGDELFRFFKQVDVEQH